MPLDLADLLPLVRSAIPVLREILHAVRLHSDGGRAITRAEAGQIGERLLELGRAFVAAAGT